MLEQFSSSSVLSNVENMVCFLGSICFFYVSTGEQNSSVFFFFLVCLWVFPLSLRTMHNAQRTTWNWDTMGDGAVLLSVCRIWKFHNLVSKSHIPEFTLAEMLLFLHALVGL